jgi:hypothetical protein
MPLPESLQKLLNNPNIQKMQLMMNYPSVQRMQQIFDNYPKINEFREKVYYSNLNIQMPIQIMDSQLQIIKNYSEVYSKTYNWNNIISSAIETYNSTKEEEFEISINEIPVTFLKSKLEIYIETFSKLNLLISKNLILKLAISYYIFSLFLFAFTSVPELRKVGENFATWIFKTGGLTFQKYFIKIVALSDKNNVSDLLSEGLFDLTKLFLFYLFKKGFNKTFKKKSK